MIKRGYEYGGSCVFTMLGKRQYFSLHHFKESGRMRVAKPETTYQQPKLLMSIVSECVFIGMNALGNHGQD